MLRPILRNCDKRCAAEYWTLTCGSSCGSGHPANMRSSKSTNVHLGSVESARLRGLRHCG